MPTPTHSHADQPDHARAPHPAQARLSVLGWPAWQRVLAVLPVLVLLWLAVLWASVEVLP